jgi:tRNA G18 (ribose-2'-O)-methylase SpoU
MKLNSHQIRKSKHKQASNLGQKIKKNPIILVLDNVLDTYNIGSFFRLADAIAAEKICLCGPVVTPPNIKIHRASIGTWKFVPWENYESTTDCLKKLKKEGYNIVICEQNSQSQPYNKTKIKTPIALVLGSEVKGVQKKVERMADYTLEIPMFGVNKSLNVLVAASIISYNILSYLYE